MTRRALVPLLMTLTLTECGSHSDAVCDAVGDCSQAGSSDWIAGCQSEGELLRQESVTVGCATPFNAYFSCADKNYVCNGNVASFPGCDGLRAQLDTCLAQATADTGCAQLQKAVSACSPADGGVVLASCSATRSCEARCLLAAEQNVCAPEVRELLVFTDCAKTCP